MKKTITITRYDAKGAAHNIKLTPREMERAYRRVQMRYRREDARTALDETLDDLLEVQLNDEDHLLLPKDWNRRRKTLAKKIAGQFEKAKDCNVAENDTWSSLAKDALTEELRNAWLACLACEGSHGAVRNSALMDLFRQTGILKNVEKIPVHNGLGVIEYPRPKKFDNTTLMRFGPYDFAALTQESFPVPVTDEYLALAVLKQELCKDRIFCALGNCLLTEIKRNREKYGENPDIDRFIHM